MDSVATVNTSHHVLDRQYFLDKIESEIQTLENEFQSNMDNLEQIQEQIWDMKPLTRNKSNPEYAECSRIRSKLNHRNGTIQRNLKKLHEEYKKYETIEI